ncbi:hypothetical protein [Psychromonas sp. KJ10-2]|uniref:hypothetical protein n=1 Tax=Psychromonas sp. KJ10-2 TaxID=3391822 RepID=UPI0039B5956A
MEAINKKKKEFINAYKKKGWDTKELALRWGCSRTRIYQLADEVGSDHKLAQSHIDKVNGLPDKW